MTLAKIDIKLSQDLLTRQYTATALMEGTDDDIAEAIFQSLVGSERFKYIYNKAAKRANQQRQSASN